MLPYDDISIAADVAGAGVAAASAAAAEESGGLPVGVGSIGLSRCRSDIAWVEGMCVPRRLVRSYSWPRSIWTMGSNLKK